mgnify:CR=1 FL=1
MLVITRNAPPFRAGLVVEVIGDRSIRVLHDAPAFAANPKRDFNWSWTEVMRYDGEDVFDECACGDVDCGHPDHARLLTEVGTHEVVARIAGRAAPPRVDTPGWTRFRLK